MSDLNFKLQLAGPHSIAFSPIAPVQSIRVLDQGIRVIVEVVDKDGLPINIRSATVRTIKLMLPDGSTFDTTGLLLSNGLDGKMYFTSSAVAPPFNQVGTWLVQAKVIISGVAQSTKTTEFIVEPNIDAN